MKAVVIERYGTADVLELKDVPTPRPKAGEVSVRVRAASINDWDWAMVQGKPFAARLLHGLLKPKVSIPGCDIAGRVEAVGDAVETLRPGDEVYGDLCLNGFGAFAECVCAPETALATKPAAMTFEQAAAIPQAGMLAVQGLIDVGGIRGGQRVLLNGAGGGVGTFALQLAKLHDVEVTAVDKQGKLGMLRTMGADHVVDYMEEDFTRSGERYDLILDVKTNRSLLAYARALNPGGTYATVGGDTGRLLRVAVLGPLIARWSRKHLRVVGLKPNKDLAYVNDLFESGRLAPVIDRTYRLEEVPEAFRFFSTGDHRGKIVVTVN
jgi:NADPH:quinone reductase-like Zn-dependent oxidoreductase